MGGLSGDWEFDRDIGSSINWGSSGIYTCWEIAWELDRKIVLVTDLVFVAWPSGYDRGIVKEQIETAVESSSPSYKRAY